MFVDYHMHTAFSDDSTYPMEDAVHQSIALGLDEICFTEHVDHGVKGRPGFADAGRYAVLSCDYEAYRKEFLRCQEKFRGQITLKFGIEFGMQTHTIAEFRKDFAAYPFDFVILSCHEINNLEFYTYKFQEGKSQDEYNRLYYEEILHVIRQYKDYSVLGHLDMIRRYDRAGAYPFEKIRPIVTEILKTAIADGKGIELNTSSFRYGLNDLTPSRDILKLYRKLGGRVLTLGSDSHKEEHIAYKLSYAREILKELGYTEFCTFDKMQPHFHRI